MLGSYALKNDRYFERWPIPCEGFTCCIYYEGCGPEAVVVGAFGVAEARARAAALYLSLSSFIWSWIRTLELDWITRPMAENAKIQIL